MKAKPGWDILKETREVFIAQKQKNRIYHWNEDKKWLSPKEEL